MDGIPDKWSCRLSSQQQQSVGVRRKSLGLMYVLNQKTGSVMEDDDLGGIGTRRATDINRTD